MKLYYHHVGLPGAREDFPKTVYKDITLSHIKSIASSVSPSSTRAYNVLINVLRKSFPSGKFNCWGVPAGASSIIKRLSPGDVVLLVENASDEGTVPALCEVKVFLHNEYRRLSTALWGDEKYPYIFFFKTERLSLPWRDFVNAIGYSKNFNPRGKFYSIADSRLSSHGGSAAFVKALRQRWGVGTNEKYSRWQDRLDYEIRELPIDEEYRGQIERELRHLEVESLSGEPSLTEENEQEPITQLIAPRSVAFRASVRALYQDTCAACGLSVYSPQGKPEVEAAHIYPKANNGSDDLRNGICLCRFHHWAFDVGWFSIRDNLTMVVRSNVPESKEYARIRKLSGRSLRMPLDQRFRPHPTFLRGHRQLHNFE